MTSVLFGQSYFLKFDPKLWAAHQPYAPLGTLYAASYLRQYGYEVKLFDAMLADSEAEWATALHQHQPQFAVLYEDNFNYLSKMCLARMRQAAQIMIAQAKTQGCTVILCGADATDHATDYLASGADFVLLGEGEETLRELLDTLTGKHPQPLEKILGLASQGQRTPRRPDLKNLDALPFPAWELIDLEKYRAHWQTHHGYFSMNMVTTRGCPFHCNWCAKPIWGQRYHARSPANVVAEMKWLSENFHPDHLWFADDIFGLQPNWLNEFGNLVEQNKINLPFKCLSRADLLTRVGEVAALKRAGARTVWLGAESGAQPILDAMEKGTRVDQIEEAAALLKSARIEVGFFLQFGYPTEGWHEIEATRQLVRRAAPDDIGISVAYPLPGTKFFERVHAQLGAKQNWHDSNDLAMLYHGAYHTDFYRQLHRTIHTEFRLRRAWRNLQHSFNWRELKRVIYNFMRLPLEEIKLRWLAATHAQPMLALQPELTPEAAATPTPPDTP